MVHKILAWFKKNEFVKVILIFTLLYLLYFYKIWFFAYLPWGGDALIKHWPSREFFYTSIVENHSFPFYTEKIYGGFNIAGDFELGYMNPINILSILLFGPFLSYKILHFFTYLLGSLGFYVFLKKRDVSFTGILIANVIFLYNFFLINHQIHFNIVLIVPLFPWTLVLIDNYFQTTKIKYVLYLSLLFAYFILWGHPQITFIVGLGAFIYSLFKSHSLLGIKDVIKVWLSVTLISIVLALPQIIPTYHLYKNSNREQIDYKEGSFNTIMLSNLVIPLQYGGYKDYMGLKIFESGYTYTEIYIYVGISATIVFIFSFLFGQDKDDWLALILIYISLVFISIRYVYLIRSIPLISMFRQWNRGVILTYFGLAFGVSQLFKKDRVVLKRPSVKRVLSLLILIIPFVFQFYQNTKIPNYFYSQALKFFNTSWQVHTMWFVIALSTLLLIVVKVLFPKSQVFKLAIALILIDSLFYTKDPFEYRFQKIQNPSSKVYVQNLTNKTVIDYHNNLVGLQYLNANYNSPFGYSQLVSKDYFDKLRGYNFGKQLIKPFQIEKIDRNLVNIINLDYVILEDGKVLSVSDFFKIYER